MRARSAVFDLYGDHLAGRDGWAPIAAVVRLLAAVDVAAPAVRTAVSRLTREGWLEPQLRGGVRGYALTPRAERRLRSARDRIYRTETRPWDGTWHVVVCEQVPDRTARDRLSASLEYLGYARMAPSTWVGPRAADELASALDGHAARTFTGTFEEDGVTLARTLWDLGALAQAYDDFVAWAETVADLDPGVEDDPERAFAARTTLVHEWRKFLFRDPGLPADVLPPDWAGRRAAARFDVLTERLGPVASRFVDDCLTGAPERSSVPLTPLQSSD